LASQRNIETPLDVDVDQFIELSLGLIRKLPSFFRKVGSLRIGLRTYGNILSSGIAVAPAT
jgi:hypothetical protein